MTSPAVARLLASAAVVSLSAGSLLVPSSAGATEQEPADTPLRVTFDEVPTSLPGRGRLEVTGTVTNTSGHPWSDLNVHFLTSAEPITTEEGLAEAVDSAPETVVGERLTDPELYAAIGDLAPGESAPYRLSIPRQDLQVSGAPGVYWMAVHVLGTGPDGRDGVADGRARTFLPLVPATTPATRVGFVVPIAAAVQRDADGRVVAAGRWQRLLSPEGRLGRLLEGLEAVGSDAPLTLLIDPAVLDAARDVASGNPARTLAPSGTEEPFTPQPGSWLARFLQVAATHDLWALPYGRFDVTAAVEHGTDQLYDEAVAATEATLAELGLTAPLVVAPRSGQLSDEVLAGLPGNAPVLLSRDAAPESPDTVVVRHGRRLLLGDTKVVARGPAPLPARDPLSLRQVLLSQAALRSLGEDPEVDGSLLVTLPETWRPGPGWRASGYFDSLDQPWILPTDAEGILATVRASPYDVPLAEPKGPRVPLTNLLESLRMVESGDLLAGLLTRNDEIDSLLAKQALLGSSEWAAHRPNRAARLLRATVADVRASLAGVRVEGPSFVTMSQGTGTFAVTLFNDLDQPITVGVAAETGNRRIRVTAPEAARIGPGRRATVRLEVAADDVGVYSVMLAPVTASGEPVGQPVRFSVRASQVGLVIWAIMGTGAGLLVLAVLRRAWLRWRLHRRGEVAAA